jgi:predicted MFS family arabinose efflux permease
MFAALAVGALGTAFFQTTLQSLLSKRAEPDQRGVVMGVYQSSSSLARFAGQAGSGTIYGLFGSNARFSFGIAAMVPAFILATGLARRLAWEDRTHC